MLIMYWSSRALNYHLMQGSPWQYKQLYTLSFIYIMNSWSHKTFFLQLLVILYKIGHNYQWSIGLFKLICALSNLHFLEDSNSFQLFNQIIWYPQLLQAIANCFLQNLIHITVIPMSEQISSHMMQTLLLLNKWLDHCILM